LLCTVKWDELLYRPAVASVHTCKLTPTQHTHTTRHPNVYKLTYNYTQINLRVLLEITANSLLHNTRTPHAHPNAYKLTYNYTDKPSRPSGIDVQQAGPVRPWPARAGPGQPAAGRYGLRATRVGPPTDTGRDLGPWPGPWVI
jgi:hypothetical protein